MVRALAAMLLAMPALADGASLPPGRVPPPRAFDFAAHERPIAVSRKVRWQAESMDARLLDAIAPLGDGTTDAGAWWRDFSSVDGARRAEREALESRVQRREMAGGQRRIHYAWEEPLVQEARATADQARLSFYPGAWPAPPVAGELEAPLIFMVPMATSWMVHGLSSPNPEEARAEFRRMIRLGRLLMQDDACAVQVLVGLRIVRDGLDALYERARKDGNRDEQALVALALLGREQCYFTESHRMRSLQLPGPIDLKDAAARVTVHPQTLDTLAEALRDSSVRRWKLEAILHLQALTLRGDAASASRSRMLLQAASRSEDAMVALVAGRALRGERAPEVVAQALGTEKEQAESATPR